MSNNVNDVNDEVNDLEETQAPEEANDYFNEKFNNVYNNNNFYEDPSAANARNALNSYFDEKRRQRAERKGGSSEEDFNKDVGQKLDNDTPDNRSNSENLKDTKNEKDADNPKQKTDEMNKKATDSSSSKLSKVKNTAQKLETLNDIKNNPEVVKDVIKDQAKQKVKEEIKKKIMSNPKVLLVLIIAGVLALVIVIVLLGIIGGLGGDGDFEGVYVDPVFDFSLTTVNVVDPVTQQVYDTVTLDDYTMGASYAQLYNSTGGLSNSEIIELYKSMFLIQKSRILSIGNYNNSTKEINIVNSNNEVPHCDMYSGCYYYIENGNYNFVDNSQVNNYTSQDLIQVAPLDDTMLTELSSAYYDLKYKTLVPDSVSGSIDNFTYNIPYDDRIKSQLYEQAKDSKDYEEILSSVEDYSAYDIYDLFDEVSFYSYNQTTSYFWPIGGPASNLSGNPTTTSVSSTFGIREINGKVSNHQGIDISTSNSCVTDIIVATKSGEVISVEDGCDTYGSYGNTCNGGYGNYVIIDHGDGIQTVYAHMAADTIVVKEGDRISQGEKIGLMGSSGSSTGCHLHFEIRINDSKVDPFNYVDSSNPRPREISSSDEVSGSDSKQTVCLTLLSNGYSVNATAALLTNMNSESSFNPQSMGDSGTSYGLCQWHNGRFTRLKTFCGNNYTTVGCQLNYLNNELRESYAQVYNHLLSNNSASDMAYYFCAHFEVPANLTVTCTNRSNNSGTFLNYVNNNCN